MSDATPVIITRNHITKRTSARVDHARVRAGVGGPPQIVSVFPLEDGRPALKIEWCPPDDFSALHGTEVFEKLNPHLREAK